MPQGNFLLSLIKGRESRGVQQGVYNSIKGSETAQAPSIELWEKCEGGWELPDLANAMFDPPGPRLDEHCSWLVARGMILVAPGSCHTIMRMSHNQKNVTQS